MVRTQVQLTEEQANRLKQIATAEHISMAEVIRRLIDERKATGNPTERAERLKALRALAGRGDSGLTNVARDHDDYLEEAYRS